MHAQHPHHNHTSSNNALRTLSFVATAASVCVQHKSGKFVRYLKGLRPRATAAHSPFIPLQKLLQPTAHLKQRLTELKLMNERGNKEICDAVCLELLGPFHSPYCVCTCTALQHDLYSLRSGRRTRLRRATPATRIAAAAGLRGSGLWVCHL